MEHLKVKEARCSVPMRQAGDPQPHWNRNSGAAGAIRKSALCTAWKRFATKCSIKLLPIRSQQAIHCRRFQIQAPMIH